MCERESVYMHVRECECVDACVFESAGVHVCEKVLVCGCMCVIINAILMHQIPL